MANNVLIYDVDLPAYAKERHAGLATVYTANTRMRPPGVNLSADTARQGRALQDPKLHK